MDIKANHLRLTGACLLDSNANKLHKTYALGMMHKQKFIRAFIRNATKIYLVSNSFSNILFEVLLKKNKRLNKAIESMSVQS